MKHQPQEPIPSIPLPERGGWVCILSYVGRQRQGGRASKLLQRTYIVPTYTTGGSPHGVVVVSYDVIRVGGRSGIALVALIVDVHQPAPRRPRKACGRPQRHLTAAGRTIVSAVRGAKELTVCPPPCSCSGRISFLEGLLVSRAASAGRDVISPNPTLVAAGQRRRKVISPNLRNSHRATAGPNCQSCIPTPSHMAGPVGQCREIGSCQPNIDGWQTSRQANSKDWLSAIGRRVTSHRPWCFSS